MPNGLNKTGDPVSEGEIVAAIETDKATFEITAPASGTLLARFFDEGTLVPVFTNLFVIAEPGENADSFRPQSAAAPAESRVEAVRVELVKSASPASTGKDSSSQNRARRTNRNGSKTLSMW